MDIEQNKESKIPEPTASTAGPRHKQGFKLKIFLGVLLALIIFSGLWVKHNIYASEFTPVRLSDKEHKTLLDKLNRLNRAGYRGSKTALKPEAYSEANARREIRITEKELNGLIADDPETARLVAIDLSPNLISIKLVIPIDEEVPVLGGKTLRLRIGIILNYKNEQPVIAIKGVSIGGIPMPNAWLGGLKYTNLLAEFGESGGFWELFSGGIENITVKEGHISIKLKA